MKKRLSPFFVGLLLAVCTLLTAGCSKDSTDDAATNQQLASLQQQIQNMQTAIASLQQLGQQVHELEAFRTELQGVVGRMQQQVAAMQTAVDGKVDAAVYARFVEETHAEMQAGSKLLAELQALVKRLSKQLDGEEESGLKQYVDQAIDDVTSLLGDYVLKRTYEEFVEEYAAFKAEITEQVAQHEADLAATTARLDGLDGEVAANTDEIERLAEILNLLKQDPSTGGSIEAAEKIVDLERSIRELERTNEALTENMEAIEENLQQQIAQIKANQVTLAQVESLFAAKSEALLADIDRRVGAALTAALDKELAAGGSIAVSIDKAIKERVGDVIGAYEKELGTLQQQVKELEKELDGLELTLRILEGRLEVTEEQIAELVKRIQSLVYVPKTADGIIHVGTTYLAATKEDGTEDEENRIELSPTKKLEYRVSPADLAGELVKLWKRDNSILGFYQEHVTPVATRAEAAGMDEFHILNVEPGNGPGELLLTVRCDHDFTHEDLAVALCVKYTSGHGVATEFTSPYTTVVGDGRNVLTRFYVARKLAGGGYEAVRDDRLEYLLPYSTSEEVKLLGDDYEVVYDNGEQVMSFADAKVRFEWDVDLQWKKEGLRDAFTEDMIDSYFLVKPAKPNDDRSQVVSVQLKSATTGTSALGYHFSDAYAISLTAGGKTVTVLPELKVHVTVCDDSYTVEGDTEIVWNYSKWEGAIGRPEGDMNPYVSTLSGGIKGNHFSAGEANKAYNHLSEKSIRELFDTDAEWQITGLPTTAKMTGSPKIRNTALQYDNARYKTQFAVEGYLYSENTGSAQNDTKVSLKRTATPPHLLGSKPITLTVTGLTFDAPPVKTIVLDASVGARESLAPVFFVTFSSRVKAEKRLQYTAEELSKYFDNRAASLEATDEMLSSYTMPDLLMTGPGGLTMPLKMSGSLVRVPAADATSGTAGYMFPALVADPVQIAGGTLSGATQFTVPDGAVLQVENGPSFRVTGTVTVTPAQ